MRERELLNSSMAKSNKRLYDYLSMLYDNAEKFQEQKFDKTKKIFYHISRHIFDVFKSSTIYGTREEPQKEKPNLDLLKNERAGLVFLSPKIDFCIDFFKLQNTGKTYAFLYKCLLTEKLDLFNASSKNDFMKLEKKLNKNEFELFEQNIDSHGNDRFWLVVEQDHIVNAIYKLGYDGLCSFGNGKNIVGNDFHNAENIGLFDPQKIKIVSREKINIKEYEKELKLTENLQDPPNFGDTSIQKGTTITFRVVDGKEQKWTGEVSGVLNNRGKLVYSVDYALSDKGEKGSFSWVSEDDIIDIL